MDIQVDDIFECPQYDYKFRVLDADKTYIEVVVIGGSFHALGHIFQESRILFQKYCEQGYWINVGKPLTEVKSEKRYSVGDCFQANSNKTVFQIVKIKQGILDFEVVIPSNEYVRGYPLSYYESDVKSNIRFNRWSEYPKEKVKTYLDSWELL